MSGDDKHDGLKHTLEGEGELAPVPGMDWQTFSNFVMRAQHGDETVPAVISGLVNAAREGGVANPQERDREWWRDFIWRQSIAESLRSINDLIDRYNAMADWHHEQAELARERMRQAADTLNEIGDFIDDVNGVLDPANPFDREKAIALLKSRGIEVDPNEDETSLRNRLVRERQNAEDEKRSWTREYEQAGEEAGYHERMEDENRRKAQELIERRDAIRNSGYSAEEEARRLKQVTEEYDADVRYRANEIERDRGNPQSADLNAGIQSDIDQAQSSRAESEVSDFEALAAGLKSEFSLAAANAVAPPEQPPPANKPLGGPGMAV